MFSAYTLLILSLLATFKTVFASPCVVFDSNFNLLAFGFGGKDYNAGTQDTWSSNTAASEITTTGRPPFDGANTTCYLSQYENAIYIMGASQASPTSVDIYDAAAKSWSTQSINAGSFDPTSFDAILDHDTNVFYALSHGELFTLDMAQLKAAQSSSISWTDVEKAPLPDGYQPVMALAQNHIHFLNVPGLPVGSAQIFVIHFSYFQPASQSYPDSSGNSFPTAYGQAASLFQQNNTAQQEFFFVPSDGSATYVVNVINNSTQTLAGPSTKDSQSSYTGGVTSIVQLTSAGAVSYLPYQPGGDSSSSKWSPVGPILAAAPPSSTIKGGTASGTMTGSTKPSSTSPNSSQAKNAGVSPRLVTDWMPMLALIFTGFTLLQIIVLV